jgi:VWFA-related protein
VSVRTDLVTVPVIVTNERGRRVAGLKANDFQLLDAGRQVDTSYFAAGTDRVAILFLLDASGSTNDVLTQQRETSLALLSRFGPRSRVAVMHFREQPELVQPFTSDERKARQAFRPQAISNRLTAIFDASLAAVRAFASATREPAERRIVILISDGLDTASSTRAESVIVEASTLGVSFYVIHLPLFRPSEGRLVERRPSKGFRDIADKTGGQFFTLGDAASSLNPRAEYDLKPIYDRITEDLLGQYMIGFYAGGRPRDGKVRSIEVRLTPHNKREKLSLRQLRGDYLLSP